MQKNSSFITVEERRRNYARKKLATSNDYKRHYLYIFCVNLAKIQKLLLQNSTGYRTVKVVHKGFPKFRDGNFIAEEALGPMTFDSESLQELVEAGPLSAWM